MAALFPCLALGCGPSSASPTSPPPSASAAAAAPHSSVDPATAVQLAALRKHALAMCSSTPHQDGDRCPASIDARLQGCAEPFLARRTEAPEFATCLGFIPPDDGPAGGAPVSVVGRCEGSAIVAPISVELAKEEAWEGASPRVVEGRTLHVAKEKITQADVQSLQLEARDGFTFARLVLCAEASRTLDAMTRTHVGDTLIMTIGSGVQAARIGSPIPGPELLVATKLPLADLCRTP